MIIVRQYFRNIFTREHITTNYQIISWWNRGRLLLNGLAIIITIIHLAILVSVFKDGWIFFMFPIIFLAFVIINILFSIGLSYELIAVKVFESKINFDKLGPDLKKTEFILSVLFLITLSVLDLLGQ